MYFLLYRRFEVQAKTASKFGFFGGLSVRLAERHLLHPLSFPSGDQSEQMRGCLPHFNVISSGEAGSADTCHIIKKWESGIELLKLKGGV